MLANRDFDKQMWKHCYNKKAYIANFKFTSVIEIKTTEMNYIAYKCKANNQIDSLYVW